MSSTLAGAGARKVLAVIAVVSAAAMGCSSAKKPFSGSMDTIDDAAPQAAARIRLSPPQVYTREQLINDRLREDSFLKSQLERSASAPLGNDLSRDISALNAFSAQVAVSADPAARVNARRQEEQADLQQQIAVAQLRAELIGVQAQLNEYRANPASAPVATSSGGGVAPSTGSAVSTAAADARLQALEGQIDKALDSIASSGATARANGVQGTLSDEIDARMAVRAQVRNAINGNALDDAHDLNGNALYHLQFNATILPGANTRQFGIASMTVEAPEVRQQDMDLLYHTWLSGLTNRLNQDLGDGKHDATMAISHQNLGPLTGLYDVARFSLRQETPSQCRARLQRPSSKARQQEILLAVHPGSRQAFEFCEDSRPTLHQLVDDISYRGDGFAQACLQAIAGDADRKALDAACALSTRSATKFSSGTDVVDLARTIIGIAPSVESGIYALGDRSNIKASLKVLAADRLREFGQAFADSRFLLDSLHGSCTEACEKWDVEALLRDARSAPKVFCQALLGTSGTCAAKGGQASGEVVAFPYSTQPVSKAQRVPTVASAANAMELALGATAQVPGSGVGIDAGVSSARRAAGRVDALEQIPEIIGFAGRDPHGGYEFGWLFGPKATLDGKGEDVLLRQRPRTVPVSVDLSVPGWWTNATLRVRVAWRGNFDGAGKVVDGEGATLADTYELPARFRLDQASLDALTVSLSRALTFQGYHQARIDKVQPHPIVLCQGIAARNITLLVYGVDLWRSPAVYLAGTMLDPGSVSVLPDMAGIAATVDAGVLAGAAEATQPLIVWTAHGAAETTVDIKRSKCDQGARAAAPAPAKAASAAAG